MTIICEICGYRTNNVHIKNHFMKSHKINYFDFIKNKEVNKLGFSDWNEFIKSDKSNCSFCKINKVYYDASHGIITKTCSKTCSDKLRVKLAIENHKGFYNEDVISKRSKSRSKNLRGKTEYYLSEKFKINLSDLKFQKCPYCDNFRKIDYDHRRLMKTCGSEICKRIYFEEKEFKSISKIEQSVVDFLVRNNKNVIQQFKIKGSNHRYDMFLPEYNLIIEYDGSYWHKDRLLLDENQTNYAISNGFNILRLKEGNLKKNFKTLLLNNIDKDTNYLSKIIHKEF